MSDHRPIGLISTVAKLFEQILLPRLTAVLMCRLSPDQAGGWLGADAAALYVWELLMLRSEGKCPDAINNKAKTWLAFLDIESSSTEYGAKAYYTNSVMPEYVAKPSSFSAVT